MVIRIASAVLTLAGLFALISGVLYWTGTAVNLIQLHMMLGLLAVAALVVIGLGQLFSNGGSWAIAISAVLVGVATVALGLTHASLIVGAFHWAVEVLHLALGLLTIGLGHIGAARYRRSHL